MCGYGRWLRQRARTAIRWLLRALVVLRAWHAAMEWRRVARSPLPRSLPRSSHVILCSAVVWTGRRTKPTKTQDQPQSLVRDTYMLAARSLRSVGRRLLATDAAPPLTMTVTSDGIAVVKLDAVKEKVNVLNTRFMTTFDGILQRLETDTAIRAAVFISGKPDNFIAGADITQLVCPCSVVAATVGVRRVWQGARVAW